MVFLDFNYRDYGPRWGTLHGGIDIGTPTGTAVAIDKPGKVLFGLYGGYDMIDTWVPSLKVQFRFAHLVKDIKNLEIHLKQMKCWRNWWWSQ